MNWLLFDAADPGLRGNTSSFLEYLPLIFLIIILIGIASAVVLAILFKKKKRKKE
jgi:predicted permease